VIVIYLLQVWRGSDGALCRTLSGHGHWVTVLALNSDYATRTAAFEPATAHDERRRKDLSGEDAREVAKKR